MSNISDLQRKIEYLEKENAYLKDLLTQAGISFEKEVHETLKGKYDTNQGARIIKKEEITAEDANQFFGMFWGRTDLYSQRTIKKAQIPEKNTSRLKKCFSNIIASELY